MTIEVRGLGRRFDGFTALDDVSLQVRPGELVALLGPSGSGKTTLLRLIAGLDRPTAGQVLFDGADVSDRPVGRRGVGFVFQHYALFKHMTVFENVAFGLRVRPRRTRPAEAEIAARVGRLLELVQLAPFAKRFPAQLSGGQRQRVALARALAIEPAVLLLDEPFGALDAQVRQELRRWLRRLHEEMRLTSIFVTHDQEEAMDLADRVVVMGAGRIEQVDTPEAVYARPATAFVCGFLGRVNRVVLAGGEPGPTAWGARVEEFAGSAPPAPGLEALVRSEDVGVEPAGTAVGVPARITHAAPMGATTRLDLAIPGEALTIEAAVPSSRCRELGYGTGLRVMVRVRRIYVFAA